MKAKLNQLIVRMKEDISSHGGKVIDPLNLADEKLFDSICLAEMYGLEKAGLQTLKNPTEIEARMIRFMENEGIDLYITGDNSSEMFVCTPYGYKAVYLCPRDVEDENKDRVLAIAHELGHYLNLKYFYNFDVYEFQLAARTEEGLIREEVIAWKNAKTILEALGYDDWVFYVNEAVRALNTYVGRGTEATLERMRKTGEYMETRLKAVTEAQLVH